MKDLLNELEIIVASEMHHKTDLEYYEFLKGERTSCRKVVK